MTLRILENEYIHVGSILPGWGVCYSCGKPFPAKELHKEKAPGDVVPEKYCMECPIEWRGPLTKPFTEWHVEKTRKKLEAIRESENMPDPD